jgi:hypothetical protein
MSVGIAQHIRSNVVGYLALFVALSGTAYAVDGPLPGQNQVGSEDIINEEVKRDDLGPDAVRTGKVLNETLLAEDIATGAISSSEVLNSTLTHFDLGTDSVRYPELDPGAFDPAEIAEIAPGFVFGIANDSIQSEEVSANSLNGSDIATNSLTGADIDETTLSALDGNDAHDQSCNPETASYLHCVELSFTAGHPMSVLMMATYQYHGVDDNPLGRCRTTLDGATISSAKLYNSDHTSEIGGSQVDVVGVDAGSHTFGFDCVEDGPDDHDLIVTNIDLAEVQLGID